MAAPGPGARSAAAPAAPPQPAGRGRPPARSPPSPRRPGGGDGSSVLVDGLTVGKSSTQWMLIYVNIC